MSAVLVVLGCVVVVAVYVLGHRDGERIGVARGEWQAARRQREAFDAWCDGMRPLTPEEQAIIYPNLWDWYESATPDEEK